MPVKRTRQWLSEELLKNAEFVVRQIKEGTHNEEGLMRMACHSYYYSIHHKCRALIPSLEGGAHSIHKETEKALTSKSEEAGKLYRNLKRARVWADYKERDPSVGGDLLDADAIIDKYNQLNKIIDGIKWE
jgi:uncharacterized protein (UPF0332 family)